MRKILLTFIVLLSFGIVGCTKKPDSIDFNPADLDIEVDFKIENSYNLDPNYKNCVFTSNITNNSKYDVSMVAVEVEPIYNREFDGVLTTDLSVGKLSTGERKSIEQVRRDLIVGYDDDISDIKVKEVSLLITIDDKSGYTIKYDAEGNMLENKLLEVE